MTEYLILRKTEKGWEEFSQEKTRSAKAAIRLALDGGTVATGEFVAVPARSWQPVKVQVEQALKFS